MWVQERWSRGRGIRADSGDQGWECGGALSEDREHGGGTAWREDGYCVELSSELPGLGWGKSEVHRLQWVIEATSMAELCMLRCL